MIHFVAETGSTNADLLARLRAGEVLAEGDWLVADRQTGGKGRQGRQWFDGAGNFMGSTAVRLSGTRTEAAGLSLAVGLAVYETVLPLLADPSRLRLKWPNDVLYDGAKLAGILLERQGDTVIAGIGVNLAQAPEITGVNTVCMAQLGPVPPRDSFAQALARQFEFAVAHWRDDSDDRLHAQWLAAAHPKGTQLTIHTAEGAPLSGTFEGLAEDGALKLRLANGDVRVIHAGDVTQGRG